ELRENGELGRAQAGGRQELIVRLRDVPGRCADGKAIALLRTRQGIDGHQILLLDKRAYKLIWAHIRVRQQTLGRNREPGLHRHARIAETRDLQGSAGKQLELSMASKKTVIVTGSLARHRSRCCPGLSGSWL